MLIPSLQSNCRVLRAEINSSIWVKGKKGEREQRRKERKTGIIWFISLIHVKLVLLISPLLPQELNICVSIGCCLYRAGTIPESEWRIRQRGLGEIKGPMRLVIRIWCICKVNPVCHENTTGTGFQLDPLFSSSCTRKPDSHPGGNKWIVHKTIQARILI